jgi:hypothetical protein
LKRDIGVPGSYPGEIGSRKAIFKRNTGAQQIGGIR